AVRNTLASRHPESDCYGAMGVLACVGTIWRPSRIWCPFWCPWWHSPDVKHWRRGDLVWCRWSDSVDDDLDVAIENARLCRLIKHYPDLGVHYLLLAVCAQYQLVGAFIDHRGVSLQNH